VLDKTFEPPYETPLAGGAVFLTPLAFQPIGELRYLEYAGMPDLDERQSLLLRPPLYRSPMNAEFLAKSLCADIFVAGDFNDINHSYFSRIAPTNRI
jgi:hypothetical protein